MAAEEKVAMKRQIKSKTGLKKMRNATRGAQESRRKGGGELRARARGKCGKGGREDGPPKKRGARQLVCIEPIREKFATFWTERCLERGAWRAATERELGTGREKLVAESVAARNSNGAGGSIWTPAPVCQRGGVGTGKGGDIFDAGFTYRVGKNRSIFQVSDLKRIGGKNTTGLISSQKGGGGAGAVAEGHLKNE